MEYSKEDKHKHYTLQCRFYNGEEEAPDWMSQNERMFWFYEQCWVLGNTEGNFYNGYLQDYPSLKDFESSDRTPLELKALICDRYCHFGGDVESFKKFYLREYQIRKTNREQRADQRRPELIAKCKYYHGEEQNPWDRIDAADEDLWRKWYWDLEKQWVDELSMSFNTPYAKHEHLKMWGVEEYFKNEGVPLSLINHILGWHNHIAENSYYELNHDSAIECYKESYLKLIPE